jgi:hypothetical protein
MSRRLGSKAPWYVIDLELLGDMIALLTWNQVLKPDNSPHAPWSVGRDVSWKRWNRVGLVSRNQASVGTLMP